LVVRLSAFCAGPPAAEPFGCPAVMFAGDASVEVERRLLAGGSRLSAQVLKVGHHGSNHSTSSAWLAAVSPAAAVIEVGKNAYGHPSFALLRRLLARGIRVWRTDLDGGIRAVLTGQGVKLSRPWFGRVR
jgi:beta-lactamase superfamily II metal-dependent hydrolase